MRHPLLRTMLIVVPMTLAIFVVGIPAAASDIQQNVTLTCSDGTNLDLTLDATSVTQLTDAVSAMNLYPAGDPPLTCSVSNGALVQSTSSGSRQLAGLRAHKHNAVTRKGPSRTLGKSMRVLSAGSPTYDYAVGGGQAPNLGCPGLPTNFALSAHVVQGAPPTTARGTFNIGSPAPSVFCQGHLNSTVECLDVFPDNSAHLDARVTQATGIFTGLQGSEIDVWVQDNGTPAAIAPDAIDDGNVPSTFSAPGVCAEGADFAGGPTAPDQPITNGNINVHDAT
jgi:hypothetical protein